MKMKFVVSLFICGVVAAYSTAYGSGLPGLSGGPVQADFSFTGDDDDAKPAPAPDRSSIVERELSGKSMSFSVTIDDSAAAPDEGTVVPPPASGEAIIQRETAPESMSFGFTD